MKPFKKRVWLSTPTMHGDEMKYIAQAYETNWMSIEGENLEKVELEICVDAEVVKHCIINSGAVVVTDIEHSGTYVGVPAKEVL